MTSRRNRTILQAACHQKEACLRHAALLLGICEVQTSVESPFVLEIQLRDSFLDILYSCFKLQLTIANASPNPLLEFLRVSSLVLADNLADARPLSETSFSPSLKAEVDRVFAAWDKPDSPGCALGIVHNGKLAYQRGYGQANLEQNLPITPSSVFYIASTSKQFTAASIALLAKQNKLSLDDDARKYLPELPAYDSPITIRHLIHHTSGIPDYLELLGRASVWMTFMAKRKSRSY
jgi:Beta-lactamase